MILIFPKYLYLIIYHPVILVTSKKILYSKFFIFEIEDIKNYFDCLKWSIVAKVLVKITEFTNAMHGPCEIYLKQNKTDQVDFFGGRMAP